MGKKLISYVTVHDADFVAHTFAPGDVVPGWAKKAITNPNVWADQSGEENDDDQEDPPADPPAGGIPPKAGAGSSADAWRAYAATAAEAAGLQIDIPADAGRGDIITALEGAGIATE